MISIIIPVFNSLAFIRKLLDSVLALKYNDFEIILIDDGSTDGTGIVCDEYASIYPTKIIVTHIKNKGVANARNVGLDLAKGEYIVFFDSDDEVNDYNLFDKYMDVFINYPCLNIVVSGYTIRSFINEDVYNDVSVVNGDYIYIDWKCEQSRFLDLFPSGFMFVLWNKIFRKSIIDKNNLRFVDMQMEDFNFILDYLSHTSGVGIISCVGYIYYKRYQSNSLVSTVRNSMVEDYNFVHNKFAGIFDPSFSINIHQVMFPQYYAVARKYLKRLDFDRNASTMLNKLLQNKLTKASFSLYTPYSWKESILLFLIKNGYYKFTKFLLSFLK